jgi:hypothetical protein
MYMPGTVIRADFTEDNVDENARIHYPCFGQRSAFFASETGKSLREPRGE